MTFLRSSVYQLSYILIPSSCSDPIRNKSFLRHRHILSEIQHHRILFQPRADFTAKNAHCALLSSWSHYLFRSHYFLLWLVLVRAWSFDQLVSHNLGNSRIPLTGYLGQKESRNVHPSHPWLLCGFCGLWALYRRCWVSLDLRDPLGFLLRFLTLN